MSERTFALSTLERCFLRTMARSKAYLITLRVPSLEIIPIW